MIIVRPFPSVKGEGENFRTKKASPNHTGKLFARQVQAETSTKPQASATERASISA